MISPTLILPPRITPDALAMEEAARARGWRVERLQNWRAPMTLREQEPVLYGEPLFAEVIASMLSLALLEAPFDWLTRLPGTYTRRSIEYTTLGEARELLQPAFIKPVEDKCFEAAVYTAGKHLPAATVLPDSTLVLVAEPVTWEVEVRCFVLERQVVTSSPYWRRGELAQTEEGSWFAPEEELRQARTFIETFLADQKVTLPPAVVVDVGKIQGRGWAVVEANAVWGSGIYGCDPLLVLPALQRACVRRETLREEDVPWVREKPVEIEW